MPSASGTGRSAPVLRLLPPGGARLAVGKLELLLAEKRTALSLTRTGILVLALPLTIVTALVTTSEYYHFERVALLALPLLVVCAGLVALGLVLLVRSLRQLRQLAQRIEAVKRKSGPFADALL